MTSHPPRPPLSASPVSTTPSLDKTPPQSAIKTVIFPESMSQPNQVTALNCSTSIVVVGANGAGKSRLGNWLEMSGPQKKRVHRIAAQRSLIFPKSASPIGADSARDSFMWAPRPGNWTDEQYEDGKFDLRIGHKYGGDLSAAATAPLNDFDALLVLLFSENYSTLLKHETDQSEGKLLIAIPDSKLRKVQRLWQKVLPNRRLELTSGEVRAFSPATPDKTYPARAMSDGERVVFYLIGQCICAANDSIMVIDEPEIHLHRAMQSTLWNAIEAERDDCTFVYLTHDLGFAANRSGASKVCVTDYFDGAFSWYTIPDQLDIPNDIYLEILGSRKPVLFVEGTVGSHDVSLYRIAYPEFTVRPIGGCSEVIAATKAFRAIHDVHHIECFGIVDRDYLTPDQLTAYERHGVFAPSVAEVESLFLLPNVVKAVAEQLVLDSATVLQEVKAHVMADFDRSRDSQAMNATKHLLALQLGRFSSNKLNIADVASDLSSHLQAIDVTAIHAGFSKEIADICTAKDYGEVLRWFNKKDLVKGIDRFFQIANGTYIEKVREMAKQGKGDISKHLLEYLPDMLNKISVVGDSPVER